MNRTSKTATLMFLLGVPLFFSVTLLANATQQPSDPQQRAADNSKRDGDKDSATADQQKMNSANRDITKKIRRAI